MVAVVDNTALTFLREEILEALAHTETDGSDRAGRHIPRVENHYTDALNHTMLYVSHTSMQLEGIFFKNEREKDDTVKCGFLHSLRAVR